jgi:putative ABC transport system permease protein
MLGNTMPVSLERLWQDLRYGWRLLAANPGFTIVAVLSLAIGIGANCAIFSFADALVLRPLPVPRPGEVYTVGWSTPVEAFGATAINSSYPDYVDIRESSHSFEGLVAYQYVTVGFAKEPSATPKLKLGMLASGNLFNVIHIGPLLGRTFRSDEDQVPARDAVIVLGHAMWTQEFASDQNIVGRRILLDGHDFTVIGVAPDGFTALDSVVRSDFFVPIMMSPWLLTDSKAASLHARDTRNLTLKGRLAPGVSQAGAQAELTTIGNDLVRAYPEVNKNRHLVVRTELQARVDRDPPDATLAAMLATLALAVLFVACANVGGLLISRAPARAREMALRLAIGAGRRRLIRQLITESLLIAIAGGVVGLGVGYAGIVLFRQIEIPSDVPLALGFEMDRRALVFSLLVSLASALLFGLIPALQSARTDLSAIMKAGDSVAPGRRRRWGRTLLVGGQVAVSVVILAVALFMYRAFARELSFGPGYRTDHLLLMSVDTSLVHYTDAQSAQFFKDFADRTREVAGVVDASLTTSLPMLNDSLGSETVIPEGYTFPPGKDSATVFASHVDERYFDIMNIPLLRGRNFTVNDDANGPKVAIVNEQLAKHYWPNQDPIGKRLRTVDRREAPIEVVGLAKTSKYIFIAEPPTEFVYFPYRQKTHPRMAIVAHAAGDSASLAGPLREVVHRLDANMPIFNVRTMEALYRMRAISIFNVLIGTVASLGLMGLGLAIVGLYGLVAYAVSRRTREIGIRMAIGANQRDVLRLILRHGVLLAGVGLVVGLAASVGAGRLLNAAFGDNDRDFGALLLVIPIVASVTSLAAYIPARRAARIDPTHALRQE